MPTTALARGRLDKLLHEVERSWEFLDSTPAIRDLRTRKEPLWLDISTEHPLLPAVDWERALSSLRVPVLRMPGILGAPTPSPRSPSVALWVTMPVVKAAFDAIGLVEGTLKAIRETSDSGELPDVHVFSEARLVEHLLRHDFGSHVVVHRPKRKGPDEQVPWSEWIAESLGDTSVDVLHLIGHGYLSANCQGAFACAESPTRDFDRKTASFVWPQQLAALLTSIGAWGVVFTAVPHNYSVAGLRLLATRVASLRAAATGLHDVARLRSPNAGLSEIYQLLLNHPQQPPPSTTGLALTMHPGRFGVPTRRANYEPVRTELADLVNKGEDVPGWMVGAQRQIAQWETHLSFRSDVAQVDSVRAGLELAKSRVDDIMRDNRNEGGPS